MFNPSKIPVTDRDRATAMDLFGDLFVLSCMFLLCSLPIITIPVACISLYDAVAHCVVGGEKEPVKRFWHTARQELIRGILMGIEWLVIGFAMFLSYTYVAALGQEMPIFKIYSYVYLITLVIPLGVGVWIVPVESRFCYKFWELHKVAAVFALENLRYTVLAVGALVVVGVVFALLPISTILMLILPGIFTLVQTGTAEAAFAPYMLYEEEEEND